MTILKIDIAALGQDLRETPAQSHKNIYIVAGSSPFFAWMLMHNPMTYPANQNGQSDGSPADEFLENPEML